MKQMSLAAVLACTLVGAPAAGQQVIGASTVLSPDYRDDRTITITGCVIKGDDGGFLLTDPVDAAHHSVTAKPARVLYWLDDDDDLKGHAGHKVAITGAIEGDIKKGEIEVEREDGHVKLEVKSGDRKIVARFSDVPAAIGTSGVGDKDVELDYIVRKVDVKSVRMLADNCR